MTGYEDYRNGSSSASSPDTQYSDYSGIRGKRDSASASDSRSERATSSTTLVNPLESRDPHHRRDMLELERVKQLKDTVDFRAVRNFSPPLPNGRKAFDRREPQVWQWFEPGTAPSPAALFLWRKDHCRQHQLRLGGPADRVFYEHFVTTNYQPHIVGHILSAQQQHERYLSLCDSRRRDGRMNYFSNEDAAKITVDRIIHNVVEATCTVSIPSNNVPSAADYRDLNNRKSLPVVTFRERDKYQNDWHAWCRALGSNNYNVLLDYAVYASHHPYSIYHKSKYGDFGSPHPYVPYSITASNEFEMSRGEQIRQEEEALAWIASRRADRRTQTELDDIGRRIGKAGAEGNVSMPYISDGADALHRATTATAIGNAAAEAVAESPSASTPIGSASVASDFIPVSVPDEVVIDQEVEQPQAMVGQPSAQRALPPSQPAPPPASAVEPTQQQAKVAAATSHSHPITVSVIVPDNLMDWIRRIAWMHLHQHYSRELQAYLCDQGRRVLPWPKATSDARCTFASWSQDFARLPPLLNLAAVVTEDELPWRAGQRENPPVPTTNPLPNVTSPTNAAPSTNSSHSPISFGLEPSNGLCESPCGPRWSSTPPLTEPPANFRVGNLFLSSCPGKKVRLNGPVRGRGAVCRDLGVDLQRFKELGVGTLVCCLSDAELETIGVKWEEYLREADRLGLDLIRIPIVEGNCPTSQAALDPWLNEIILHCTLKGINVLVHCRGGVGRAGTLAACWLIKMGLVDEHAPEKVVLRHQTGDTWPDISRGGGSGMSPGQEIMWQSVQVVRLRRSTKAIETAEQAAYVARFGDYIAQRSRAQQAQGVSTQEDDHVRDYLRLSRAFWQRLRRDAQGWVSREKEAGEKRHQEQERAVAEGRALSPNATKSPGGLAANGLDGKVLLSQRPQEQVQASTNGDADHLSLQSQQAMPSWASNINTRHAAQLPNSGARATNEGSQTPQVALSSPARTVTSSAAPSSPPAVLPTVSAERAASISDPPEGSVLPDRLDANGEPKRKRRNTNTLSVAEMHLDDIEGARVGVATTTSPHSDFSVSNTTLQAEDEEMEMDSFPVNGR